MKRTRSDETLVVPSKYEAYGTSEVSSYSRDDNIDGKKRRIREINDGKDGKDSLKYIINTEMNMIVN